MEVIDATGSRATSTPSTLDAAAAVGSLRKDKGRPFSASKGYIGATERHPLAGASYKQSSSGTGAMTTTRAARMREGLG